MSYSKTIIRNIIQTITTTIDDNITAAGILFLWEGGPETLKYLFEVAGFDVVVAIADPATDSMRWIQDVPEHHPGIHIISVITIDKTGVTATLMQEKMRLQMRATVEAAAQGANYTLKILRERPDHRRTGGIDKVWRTDYYIEHKDA